MGQCLPFSKEQFQEFILTTISEQKQRGFPSGVLIMDEDCAMDDADGMTDLIQSSEYTNIFLPPNSPFLNATEVLFGEFRELFTAARLEITKETMLVDTILEGTKLMDVMDCEKYVESVLSYVPRCLEMEPIEMVNLHTIYAELCNEEDDTMEIIEETFVE